uniref:ResB-like domain-containing protein n=1 Tax=Desulfobacca acetoxidans TaxID=60893 RepID=A0A7V4G989_9BACT
MSPQLRTASLPERVWGALTSLRLTLVLLLMLAGLGLVGTVRPQVFATWWFWAPLGAFTLNLLSCFVKGLPEALRRVRQPLSREAALALPERARLAWPRDRDPRPWLTETLKREVGKVHHANQENTIYYWWERGRFRPLGPYVVHLALLCILGGALVGRWWGLEGQLNLVEGESAQSFHTPEGPRPLDFEVRLDRFQVTYYPNSPMVQEFRSDLTFQKAGEPPVQAVCRVNEPVTFGGLTFYQSRWEKSVRFRVEEGEAAREVEAVVNRVVELPEGRGRFKVLDFEENLVRRMGERVVELGPWAQVVYLPPGGDHPLLLQILKNYPERFPQPGPHRFVLLGRGSKLLSGLQVKHDPGVPWVYLGFVLLLPGFYLAFLRPPERWALVLSRGSKGGWEGRLKGAAPRSQESFTLRLERLREKLQSPPEGQPSGGGGRAGGV